jgi:peptide/nickel transport system substrate-binding protein
VIKSIALLQSEEGASFYTASEVQDIAGVEALDPLTIEIETKRPDPILPRRANLFWILPPNALAEEGVQSFAQRPIGSGPFQLADWGDRTGSVRFDAFAGSWRAPVAIKTLTIFLMQDPITRLQALRSGQVDIAEQLSFDDIGQLSENLFQTYQKPAPVVSGIAFRVIGNESSPVADQRVRQAMNLAINREEITDYLFKGTVTSSGQGAAPFVNGHNPDVQPWPYDPDRARQLLEEADFDFDRTLKIHVTTGIANNDALIFQIVAQSLQSVGIKVELRSIPYANWLTSFLTNQWGDVDAFSLAWDNSAYFDAIRAETYTGCYKAQPFFCAEETKPRFDAISVEMDAAKRTHMLRDLMAQLHEIAPAIWLVTGTVYAGASRDVGGLTLTSRGIPYDLVTLGEQR